MKFSQYMLILGVLVSFHSFTVAAMRKYPFVLNNKHSVSVYYAVGQSEKDSSLKDLREIKPKRWGVARDINVDKTVYVRIALEKEPKDGGAVDQYTFTPGSYDSINLEVTDDTDTEDERAVVRDGYMLRVGKARTTKTRSAVKDASAKREDMKVKQVRHTAEKKVVSNFRRKQLSDMNVDELEREVVKAKAALKGKDRDERHDARLAELDYVRTVLAARYVQLNQ